MIGRLDVISFSKSDYIISGQSRYFTFKFVYDINSRKRIVVFYERSEHHLPMADLNGDGIVHILCAYKIEQLLQ